MRYRGQVLAVDRANRVLTARLWGEVVEGVLYSSGRFEPWPLCDAWFEQQGAVWRCVRPIGHRRVLFHDDFTRVSASGLSGATFVGSLIVGDLPWVASGGGTISAAQGSDAAGSLSLDAVSGNGVEIHLDADACSAPPDGMALYQIIRFKGSATGAPTNPRIRVLGDHFDGGFWLEAPLVEGEPFVMVGAEGVSEVIDGTAVVFDQWYVAELLIGADWILGWVDGNGPTHPSSLVASAFAMTPYAVTLGGTVSGGTKTASVDYVSTSLVTVAANALPEAA